MPMRKIIFLPILLYIFIGGGISYLLFHNAWSLSTAPAPVPDKSIADSSPCDYSVARLKGYQYIRPILYADKNCESERMASIKQEISKLVDAYKSNGVMTSASVYIRDLKQNDWISYNEQEQYNPGSLLKVAILITCLHKAETDPYFLEKEVVYDKPLLSPKIQSFPSSQSLQLGHKYTLRQVLSYMIVYSDNIAARLVSEYFSVPEYKKTFADLGLPEPDQNSPLYTINVRDYSVLMEVLYNSSYLSTVHSEFAISLLSQSDFKSGLVSGLPSSIKIAHKFGEEGNQGMEELHDSGIVYLNDSPYIITIMTKGPDKKKLAPVIAEFSKMVFDYMSKNS